jgi:protein-S-isoprenylcysteine O-methyltransferase Ste14
MPRAGERASRELALGGEHRTVELNRYHYFIAGVIVLLIGIQLRMVESYVLNEDTTRWLMERSEDPTVQAVTKATQMLPAAGPLPRKTIVPPQWMGWAAVSLGSVLILHSLALPKPAG